MKYFYLQKNLIRLLSFFPCTARLWNSLPAKRFRTWMALSLKLVGKFYFWVYLIDFWAEWINEQITLRLVPGSSKSLLGKTMFVLEALLSGNADAFANWEHVQWHFSLGHQVIYNCLIPLIICMLWRFSFWHSWFSRLLSLVNKKNMMVFWISTRSLDWITTSSTNLLYSPQGLPLFKSLVLHESRSCRAS